MGFSSGWLREALFDDSTGYDADGEPSRDHIRSRRSTYGVSYPLLWGGQQYQECDWYVGSQTYYNLVSNNHGYSYGQTLTTGIAPATITGISGTSSPYTVSVSGSLVDGSTYSPAFVNGSVVTIAGATPSTLNGSIPLTASSAGSFTATTTATGTWSSGGTATGAMGLAWAAIGKGVDVYVNDQSLLFAGLQNATHPQAQRRPI